MHSNFGAITKSKRDFTIKNINMFIIIKIRLFDFEIISIVFWRGGGWGVQFLRCSK